MMIRYGVTFGSQTSISTRDSNHAETTLDIQKDPSKALCPGSTFFPLCFLGKRNAARSAGGAPPQEREDWQ